MVPKSTSKVHDETVAMQNNKDNNEPPPVVKGSMQNILFSEVGGGKEMRPLFMIKVAEETIKSETLVKLQAIIGDNVETKEYSKFHFSNAQGAVIADSWIIGDYLKEVQGKESSGSSEPPKNKTPNTEAPVGAAINTPEQEKSAVTGTLKAYLKQSSEGRKLQEGDIPKVEPELPTIPSYFAAPKVEIPRSSISKEDWKAKPNTNPQVLTEESWRLINMNNAFCYGLSVVRQEMGNGKSSPVGLIRAPYPAFRVKPRKMFDEEDESEPTVRVPNFVIDDHSYVSIYETKTEFQSSLSKASIDNIDISASLGLPAFGGVLGFGGGVKSSTSTQVQTDESGESSMMNISYNFPRVCLRLDEYSLEMTDRCVQALKTASARGAADRFLEEFGDYFTTRMQLGGRLFASEEFDGKNSASAKDVKSSLKVQAALSFRTVQGGGKGSGEAGVGHGKGDANSRADARSESTLQWQANGGDTLLCNNPPEWCPTVAAPQNWRVINRAGNRHILNIMARFDTKVKVGEGTTQKEVTVESLVKTLLNESIKDPKAPTHQRPTHQRQGRMFYLRISEKGKYLTAYHKDSGHWNTSYLESLGMMGAKMPDGWGIVTMRTEVKECHQFGCYLEFLTPKGGIFGEDNGGNGVIKIMYGQPYVLRNPSTELFISIKAHEAPPNAPAKTSPPDPPTLQPEPTFYPVTTSEQPTEGYWILRGCDGTDKGPVNQLDEVTLRWVSATAGGGTDDMKTKILHMFFAAFGIGLLQMAEKTTSADELKLTMMYKDVWEKKA